MKLNKIYAMLMLVATFGMVACGPQNAPSGPGAGTIVTPPPTNGDQLTVAQAIEKQDASIATVKGYVVGWYSSHINDKQVIFSAEGTADTTVIVSNIVIADDATCVDQAKCLCIQLPSGVVRKLVNLKDNPTNLGKEIILTGTLEKYNTMAGLKNTSYAEIDGKKSTDTPKVETTGNGTQENPYLVSDVIALDNAQKGNYFVKGVIVGQVKGGATGMTESSLEWEAPFSGDNNSNTNILIATEAGVNTTAEIVAVQLPAGFLRDTLNLVAHPENLGKEVIIYGSLEKYFGTVGIKNMTRAFMDGAELVLEIGDEPQATVATLAEFKAAEVNTTKEGVYYELTGTVSNITSTTYGNFDLVNSTDTVYVYGLTATYLPLSSATKANNDKSFASLNLKADDVITIRGVRADFNGKIEVLGAYFVKKIEE